MPGTPSLGWHGNSILVRPSFEATRIGKFDLPGVEPRGALIVDVADEVSRYRVIALHLGLLRASRRLQLSELNRQLEALEPTPTILAGDLNEWSLKVGLGRLARRFTIHAPGASFPARLPVASLDRIALDQSLEPHGAGVLRTKQARRASDHLPIWMDVHLRPDSPISGTTRQR